MSLSVTFILFPFFSTHVMSCLNESQFYGVMFEYWNAAASACVRWDAGMLSDASTSNNTYNHESSAPFRHVCCSSIYWMLKWLSFRKNTVVVWLCTTLFLSPSVRKWCSPGCIRSFQIWGRKVLLFACWNYCFQWQFYGRQWSCNRQGNSKGRDVGNLKAWGCIFPFSITCCCMAKMAFLNP